MVKTKLNGTKKKKIEEASYLKDLAFFPEFVFIFYATFSAILLIGGDLKMRLAALISLAVSIYGAISADYPDKLMKKGLINLSVIFSVYIAYYLIKGGAPCFDYFNLAIPGLYYANLNFTKV